MPNNLHHTKLLNLLLSQEGALDRLYRQTSVQLAAALKRYKLKKASGMWAGNKAIEKEIDRIIAAHGERLKQQIVSNIESSWALSNKANDEVVHNYLKGTGVSSNGMILQNTAALAAFTARQSDGFDLSDRVWKLNKQTKEQLETLVGSGVLEGRSAVKMAGDIKQYLKEPNRRYRRIRDKETGKLILSNPAKNYHPGRGVYRSSFKNALRLSRNETNIAYRTADHLRVQQMPFVVGIEVHLSNAHPAYDICDELVGKYPKDFKFTGWHPNCLCYTTTVQLPKEKFIEYMKTGKIDGRSVVKNIPGRASNFLASNMDKIRKSKPYFLTDNPKYIGNNLSKKGTKQTKTANSKPARKLDLKLRPEAMDSYEKQLDVKINNEIFEYLSEPIELKTSNTNSGAYYHPVKNYVRIPIDKRRKLSKWKAASVVYHEFGHVADWQHGFKNHREVISLIYKYRRKYAMDNNRLFKEIESRIDKKGFLAASLDNHDLMEKAGAAADTLMSLNSDFGRGHSKEYFKISGRSEAEFIAHAFENKFAGNELFKEVMPDLYEEMIELINNLKP